MPIGAMFPTCEIGNDPIAIRDFAQAAEGMGFEYLMTTDHVLQVDPKGDPNVFAPYTIKHAFHEPFVLYGFIAACTQKIGLGTAVLILPQRQTVLVAKQAAELDVLSGGRVRLGIGIGWQQMEYVALNETWTNRGKRSEEQIALMRQLWCNEMTSFKGKFHDVGLSGLNPNSVQKPIPIWIGGMADQVAERVGRMADGWIPVGTPEQMKPQLDIMYAAAEKAGRDPKSIGIEIIGGLASVLNEGSPLKIDDVMPGIKAWKDAGATHFCFSSQHIILDSMDKHLKLLAEFKKRFEDL